MAKQYGSFMGGFAGRLGPAVGYMWNGVWVVRSLPGQVRNPRTAAQVERREAFKGQVQLAAQMREAVVQGLTQLARRSHMTSYNLFVSLNQPCFALADGALEVDWQHLQLSAGGVAPIATPEAALGADNVLTVSFDPNRTARRSRGRDRVWAYVYCPELAKGLLAAPVYRRDKRLSLMLPDDYGGRRLCVYLFVQDELGEGSPTECAVVAADADPAAAAPAPEALSARPADASTSNLSNISTDTYGNPDTAGADPARPSVRGSDSGGPTGPTAHPGV